METKELKKDHKNIPTLFNDFFKPWDEWFENGIWFKTMNTPSVNITEEKDRYLVSLAAPGLKKNDFKSTMIIVESTAFSCNFEKRLCSSFEIISASLFEALQFLIPAIFDNTDILVSNRNIQSFHICTLLYLMVCQCLLITFKSNQHF